MRKCYESKVQLDELEVHGFHFGGGGEHVVPIVFGGGMGVRRFQSDIVVRKHKLFDRSE